MTTPRNEDLRNELIALLKDQPLLYVFVVRSSRSGMTRYIKIFHGSKSGQIFDATWLVAKVCKFKLTENSNELILRGCGFSPRDVLGSELGSLGPVTVANL